MKIFSLYFILSLVSLHSYCETRESLLVDHQDAILGVSFSIPSPWEEKILKRSQSIFIPTPEEGVFIEVSVLNPEGDDASSINPEFFLYDIKNAESDEFEIEDFQSETAVLSDQPAYRISYTLVSKERFKVEMVFLAANRKIYLLRYQSVENKVGTFNEFFNTQIVPSFKISAIQHTETQYVILEIPEHGFQFYYPDEWRSANINYAVRPTRFYANANTSFDGLVSSEARESMRRRSRLDLAGEGVFMGRDTPIVVAPDPHAFVTVTVFRLAYRYDASDVIKSYMKAVQLDSKKFDEFEHMRQLSTQVGKELAMEYTYRYHWKDQDDKNAEPENRISTHYVVYANERLYDVRYVARDDRYSNHVKEVERALKYFKFIPVKE